MRTCARAIVINNDNILLMKRFKMGKEYYTLPGGTIEAEETAGQAALREVLEETTILASNPRLVFIEDAEQPYGTQFIFLCEYQSGSPVLPADSEEAEWSTPGKNTYEPLWFSVNRLEGLPFVSTLLCEAIIMALKHGWPKEPYRFSPKHSSRLS